MNRKDMIIVAVLLNAVILSVLFVLAVNSENPLVEKGIEFSYQDTPEDKLPAKLPGIPVLVSEADEEVIEDKADWALTDLESNENEAPRQKEWALFTTLPSDSEVANPEEMGSDNIIEIVVKKGDSLDRIARANGTTIQSIRSLNSLKNDYLKIGQVLHIDVGSAKKKQEQQNKPSSNVAANQNSVGAEPVYYIMKSGDSPWKVAKQFHVNMDELLRLNQLNEEKARNLKVGDKIRVQ